MPFSSVAGGTSLVKEPSNTGGLGGVMLHGHTQGKHIRNKMIFFFLFILSDSSRTVIYPDGAVRWRRSLVAVEGQFD